MPLVFDWPYYLTLVPALVLAITCHEFVHAALANACGDRTAREQGRLTLNPLAHLDPLGTLMIFLVGFGWGKPVPVNLHRLRHPRADALVSAAGPLTNLLLAYLAAQWFLIHKAQQPSGVLHSNDWLALWLAVMIQLNLGLCFFNLIPLFPLDGSHVLPHVLPRDLGARVAAWNHRYGAFVLLGTILLGRFTHVDLLAAFLNPLITFFSRLWLG